MTGVLAIGHIFRLGFGMLMLAGMAACDDAPKTPTPKSSEVKKLLILPLPRFVRHARSIP